VGVDFASVLTIATGNNPRIAFAREQIVVAYEQLTLTQLAWLPTLRAGFSFHHHNGALQSSTGGVQLLTRSSFRAGLGVSAVGTGTIGIPGISTNIPLKDAIFGPKIARSAAQAQQGGSTAAINRTLLSAALAYLDLLQAEQQRAIAEETTAHAKVLADLTANFQKIGGLVPEADVDRAQTEYALRQNQILQAEDRVKVAAAVVRELLSLRQDVKLQPAEAVVVPLELTPPGPTTNELIAAGLSNRPELVQSRYLVAAARYRLLRDRYAPFLPTVILGISQGNYSAGPDLELQNTHNRFDLDAIAYWELRNLGTTDIVAAKLARSQLRQSQLDELAVMDQVAREIYQYDTDVQSAKRQIAIAQRAVQNGVKSYERNLERIKQNQGLPLEVLQSIQALDQARRDYLRSVVAYNDAQFRLLWALGWPTDGVKGVPLAGGH
jgi:outer membrane protein TolC